MPAKVVAIWLDGAERDLVEKMMEAGELPVLASLRDRGMYGPLQNQDFSAPEVSYGMVLTGQPPERTGNWMVAQFNPLNYTLDGSARLKLGGQSVFWALDPAWQVATFDLPQLPLQTNVHGLQVLAWGAHSAKVPPISDPPEVYAQILEQFGEHPTGRKTDFACLDDAAAMLDLHRRLLAGSAKRAQVTTHLLQQKDWDLFFTAFSESHVAGHYFWPHPDLTETLHQVAPRNLIRPCYRALDQCLGQVLTAAGPQARCLVFSVEGMKPNADDLPSMVFLPELLYRYSFPGCHGLELEEPNPPPSPESLAGLKNWVMEMWNFRHRSPPWVIELFERLPRRLALLIFRWLKVSPPLQSPEANQFWGWQPVGWYEHLWPHMKAFALVSNSEGYIRLNLRGREKQGRVAPSHYDRVCQEIRSLLLELREPESGEPAVTRIIAPRYDLPGDGHPHPADLIVQWNPRLKNKIFSPRFGMWGPVPYHRGGSHTPDGFFFAQGPGLSTGRRPEGKPIDIGPTILEMMGATPPSPLPGKSLFSSNLATPLTPSLA
jgi:predicted AlkP superfamily phosphohydrolase/phosphomutase